MNLLPKPSQARKQPPPILPCKLLVQWPGKQTSYSCKSRRCGLVKVINFFLFFFGSSYRSSFIKNVCAYTVKSTYSTRFAHTCVKFCVFSVCLSASQYILFFFLFFFFWSVAILSQSTIRGAQIHGFIWDTSRRSSSCYLVFWAQSATRDYIRVFGIPRTQKLRSPPLKTQSY